MHIISLLNLCPVDLYVSMALGSICCCRVQNYNSGLSDVHVQIQCTSYSVHVRAPSVSTCQALYVHVIPIDSLVCTVQVKQYIFFSSSGNLISSKSFLGQIVSNFLVIVHSTQSQITLEPVLLKKYFHYPNLISFKTCINIYYIGKLGIPLGGSTGYFTLLQRRSLGEIGRRLILNLGDYERMIEGYCGPLRRES